LGVQKADKRGGGIRGDGARCNRGKLGVDVDRVVKKVIVAPRRRHAVGNTRPRPNSGEKRRGLWVLGETSSAEKGHTKKGETSGQKWVGKKRTRKRENDIPSGRAGAWRDWGGGTTKSGEQENTTRLSGRNTGGVRKFGGKPAEKKTGSDQKREGGPE